MKLYCTYINSTLHSVFVRLVMVLLYVSVILCLACFWYDLIGDLGTLKIFPYTLMIIASLFYAILAYERFYSNVLFPVERNLSSAIANLFIPFLLLFLIMFHVNLL